VGAAVSCGGCLMLRVRRRLGKVGGAMNLSKSISNFLREESGQSTTEYILILSVVVMVAMKFKDQFGRAITGLLTNVTGKANTFTQDE
jgi:pilus assembly protein Flp/PilA